jgi:tetratricopeptide (TPR) repeat protein
VFAHRYRARASIRLSGSLGLAEGDEVEDLPIAINNELSDLDRLVVTDARIRTIYRCRAAIADHLFQPARALLYLEAAIERGTIDENDAARIDRASLLLATGEVDAAAELFRTVLAGDPASGRAAQGLAEVERRRTRREPERIDGAKPDAPEIEPWSPTHRAPPDGAHAFLAPGGAEPPTAHLEGGLVLQRLEDSGKWVRLRCENGWECWADRNLLVPIRETWTPTHVIPAGGMASRTAPYAGADDAGEVTGGLEVEVLSRVGDWAHVRFENEWTCWLADEPLQRRR